MAKQPEINDPYVGKVFGNILDMYHSPTYNIKLYMIGKEYAHNLTAEQVYDTNEPLAPPGETVVLAQTGVTGTQIDDLSITTLIDPDGPKGLRCSFTIVQPGAASFLDEIQLAKAYLGYDKKDAGETTMILEIRFQGYSFDNEDFDEEVGGVPEVISGPYRFKINLATFSVELDAKGSRYDLTAVIENTHAFHDAVFRLQQQVKTAGSTITQHVDALKEALNEWHTKGTANKVPDQIDFDLSGLIGEKTDSNSLDIISDESLLTGGSAGAENVNAVMNETFSIRDAIEKKTELASLGTDKGSNPEPIFNEDNITFKEGTSISQFFYVILSMNQEFYSKITRVKDIEDPESDVKADQGFTSWVKVLCTVETLEFCETRNVYAKKYIYKPVLYKVANSKVAVKAEEQDVTEEDKQTRLEQFKAAGCLKKAYNYIFTGVNDQILDLNIKFDRGAATMLPPRYGAVGDHSVLNANQNTPFVPEEKDVSLTGLINNFTELANQAKDKSIVEGLLDRLAGESNDIRDNFINELANFTSFDQNTIRNVIENKIDVDGFIDGLTRDVREQLANIKTSSTPGEDTTPPTEPPGETYQPELSKFIYSTDFLEDGQTEIPAGDITRLGYVTFDSKNVPKDLTKRFDTSQDLSSVTDAATYKSFSTKNKLFGFLQAQNTEDKIFLMKLDMTVRGDPWYLGKVDIGSSSDDTANFNKDHQLFWLRIASPEKYDPDWTDEDSELNSGYWKYDNTSKTFTGVYRYIKVENVFSGGEYSVQISATREFNLDKPAYKQDDAEDTSTPQEQEPDQTDTAPPTEPTQ